MLDVDAYSNTFLSSIPELQLSNAWILTFYDIDFPNRDFLIKSTNLPLYNLSIEKTEFDLIIPKDKENFGSFKFSFYETTKFDGFNYCYDWLSSIYDFEKRLFKKDFNKKKRNAIISFYRNYPKSVGTLGFSTTVTNSIIMRNAQFFLKGIMIQNISDLDLSEDGEPLTFDVDLEIQQVEYNKGNEKII
jgi:hypothetical protein